VSWLLIDTAWAQMVGAQGQTVWQTLVKWTPLMFFGPEGEFGGFVLNIVVSFIAMALGTFMGLWLGLGQVSPNAFIRRTSWLITQTFPQLALAGAAVHRHAGFPFQIDLGIAVTIPIPGLVKATFGLSLPIMANTFGSRARRHQLVPTASGRRPSLAFTRSQTLWRIILPQCFKRMIPPWMNWYCHPHHGDAAGLAARREGDHHPVAPGHGRRRPPRTAGAVLRLLPRDLLHLLLSHRALDHRAGTQVCGQTVGPRPMTETWTPDQPIISIKDVHKSLRRS
jgi:hypothetical protein